MPLAGSKCFLQSKRKTAIFRIFSCSYIGRTNFWPLSKFWKSHVLSSRIFISEKGCLGTGIANGSVENLERIFFWYLTKHVALRVFCFELFSLVPQTLHIDPKKHCFWDGMNWGRWVYVGFILKDKHNSHKSWKRNATYVLLGTKEGQVYARATSHAKPYGYACSNPNVIWLRDLRSIYYLNSVADCQTLKSVLYRIRRATLLFNVMELRCESLSSRSADLPVLNFGDSRLSISSLFSKNSFGHNYLIRNSILSVNWFNSIEFELLRSNRLVASLNPEAISMRQMKQNLNTFFPRKTPQSLVTTSWGFSMGR